MHQEKSRKIKQKGTGVNGNRTLEREQEKTFTQA